MSLTPDLDGPAVDCIGMEGILSDYGVLIFPPDPVCAVGPTHVINVTNGVLQWRPRTDPQDAPEFEEALPFFFGIVDTPTEYAYTTDPKVIYDQYADRFVLVLIGGETVDQAYWLLAVSKTSNPNDGWWRHLFPGTVSVLTDLHWADYPGLAVDDEAIYLTANMFRLDFTRYGPRLWIIRKTPGAYTGPDNFVIAPSYDLKALGLGNRTTQPAHTFGPVPNGMFGAPFGTFLVNFGEPSAGAEDFLRVVSVNDPISTAGGPFFINDFIACGDMDNRSVAVPDAPQFGGPELIDTVYRQAYNAVWRNGDLFLGSECVPPAGPDSGQTTAHWWRISTSFDGVNTPTLALADQGDIGAEDLGAGTFTFVPNVMVDAHGNLAVGFSASGPNIYAGAYYATRAVDDPAGTIGPTCTLAPGLDYYDRVYPPDNRNRWGDYTGLALSPVDETTFWVYNEYAGIGGHPNEGPTLGQGLWNTKLGRFHLTQPVSVAITSFDASVSDGAVVLRGDFRSDLVVTAVNVYRGGESGPLAQIGTVTQDRSGFEYVDRDVAQGATYRYRIGVVDADGEVYSPIATVSIDPLRTMLAQNHPNPFNPATDIPFSLAESGPVSLDIYDAAGRRVRHLLDGVQTAGTHTARWDGRDDRGRPAASGVYFCRLRAGKVSDTMRMVLLE
jgi:hypothetical protein